MNVRPPTLYTFGTANVDFSLCVYVGRSVGVVRLRCFAVVVGFEILEDVGPAGVPRWGPGLLCSRCCVIVQRVHEALLEVVLQGNVTSFVCCSRERV